MTMTITEALVELKTLDNRIDTGIRSLPDIVVSEGEPSWPKGKSSQSYVDDAKSKLQSVQGLIVRRSKIRSAIAESNSRVQVTVAGEQMTVAEAIQRKKDIDYTRRLVEHVGVRANRASTLIDNVNNKAQKFYDEFVNQRATSSAKIDEALTTLAGQMKAEREAVVVDPYDSSKFYLDESEKIQAFFSTVDVVLTISNSTNYIAV